MIYITTCQRVAVHFVYPEEASWTGSYKSCELCLDAGSKTRKLGAFESLELWKGAVKYILKDENTGTMRRY